MFNFKSSVILTVFVCSLYNLFVVLHELLIPTVQQSFLGELVCIFLNGKHSVYCFFML